MERNGLPAVCGLSGGSHVMLMVKVAKFGVGSSKSKVKWNTEKPSKGNYVGMWYWVIKVKGGMVAGSREIEQGCWLISVMDTVNR